MERSSRDSVRAVRTNDDAGVVTVDAVLPYRRRRGSVSKLDACFDGAGDEVRVEAAALRHVRKRHGGSAGEPASMAQAELEPTDNGLDHLLDSDR
jgi:hypothetical protein